MPTGGKHLKPGAEAPYRKSRGPIHANPAAPGRAVRDSGIQPGAIAPGNRRQRRLFNDPRRQTMKWETPTACDFRFGFEITMYIAAR